MLVCARKIGISFAVYMFKIFCITELDDTYVCWLIKMLIFFILSDCYNNYWEIANVKLLFNIPEQGFCKKNDMKRIMSSKYLNYG